VIDAVQDATGTVTIRLEADALSFDQIQRHTWPAGWPDLDRASTPRTPQAVGRDMARAVVQASPRTGIRQVVVRVRSASAQDDPSRVTLTYPLSDLSPARSQLDRG
jgi:hypothetical protein